MSTRISPQPPGQEFTDCSACDVTNVTQGAKYMADLPTLQAGMNGCLPFAVSTNSGELDAAKQSDKTPSDRQQPALLEQVVDTILALLASSKLQTAKLALQLLPAIERVITAHQPEMLQGFATQIWNVCRSVQICKQYVPHPFPTCDLQKGIFP